MKVAELIAEVELLQQKQLIQNEAEKLKLQERLTKAKIRIQVCNTSRFAKFEIEQERGTVIIKKEQNPQYKNTWDLQCEMDGVNLPHKATKEKLEHGRDRKKSQR